LERAELGGDVRSLIAGHLLAGRLKLIEGDIAEATAYLERARPLVEESPFLDWTSRFERLRVDLWLAGDGLRAAMAWAEDMLANDTLGARPESDIAQLAVARVLIDKGDAPSIERATALIARLGREAEVEGRTGIQIEALVLQALAHRTSGDQTRAMIFLERALRLAEPEGYVRLFADFGLPMTRLLQEAHSRDVMPDYVARLLAACNTDFAPHAAGERTLPEQLTHRERDVLRLIAAGLTNREIGDALFISAETVKKHTGSIYSKLAVNNRTEAASKARELDLLR
jgi:LuxR family maltose regulon positive regulatory protein